VARGEESTYWRENEKGVFGGREALKLGSCSVARPNKAKDPESLEHEHRPHVAFHPMESIHPESRVDLIPPSRRGAGLTASAGFTGFSGRR